MVYNIYQDESTFNINNGSVQFVRRRRLDASSFIDIIEEIQLLDWAPYSPMDNVWGRMESILIRHYFSPADSDTLLTTLEQVMNELMVDDG